MRVPGLSPHVRGSSCSKVVTESCCVLSAGCSTHGASANFSADRTQLLFSLPPPFPLPQPPPAPPEKIIYPGHSKPHHPPLQLFRTFHTYILPTFSLCQTFALFHIPHPPKGPTHPHPAPPKIGTQLPLLSFAPKYNSQWCASRLSVVSPSSASSGGGVQVTWDRPPQPLCNSSKRLGWARDYRSRSPHLIPSNPSTNNDGLPVRTIIAAEEAKLSRPHIL